MKNMTMLLVLSLMSYQALASSNKVDSPLAENTGVESPFSEGENKKILDSIALVGDASLSSIEMQAKKKAKELGASRYKIIGASGETQLRGHVIFYQ
ncbi:DUF1471 domain-containing protein [Providencia rettgeri]|uniref:DUF1471 domain-containing protein n=1 Tax=Providencia TaxID=586 RepID=UPI001BD2581D|nr:DUF1471 domain-containing protein [Providencia rettgeri]ELR5073420.1 DUF1471 domain-containing protein [Providencia stuartii]ELR5069882.1 DUF1471 domain-containing protein [Providencia rettgeri]ELR5223779.1 DUF1471 domain-containing protein [Providencia rettgeri]MDX7323967.1 DUF1471 domain-containing protein [Providencia rettgeri]UPS62578.1 DUF1471 domain-containing protein [Providencia rettgeri]